MKIGIVGAGAWGTALGHVLQKKGYDVLFWEKDTLTIEALKNTGENPKFLPGFQFQKPVQTTNDLADLNSCTIILIVIAAQAVREISNKLCNILDHKIPVISCSKGMENKTKALMTEIISFYMPKNPVAVLTGPSFASEVAENIPTSVSLACDDPILGQDLVDILSEKDFMLHYSTDIIGVQAANIIKNVLAIACGYVIGLGWGDNARSALFTNAFQEFKSFIVDRGGEAKTAETLAGLGDLMLTSFSPKSRNFTYGMKRGKAYSLDNIHESEQLVEGYYSAKALQEFIEEKKLNYPICTAIYNILYKDTSPDSLRDFL